MVSAKRLAQMAKKWQRMAAIGRKRLTRTTTAANGECCETSPPVAMKGHCVVYTAERVRFEVPLAYLGMAVFSELLTMSQEEFGFAGGDDGMIMLPCDAAFVEYALCLLRRDAPAEVVRAFMSSVARPSALKAVWIAAKATYIAQAYICDIMKVKELLSEAKVNLELKNAEFTKFEEKLSQEKLELKFQVADLLTEKEKHNEEKYMLELKIVELMKAEEELKEKIKGIQAILHTEQDECEISGHCRPFEKDGCAMT
ncbi:auxin-responsive protein SAUR36-like [Hordeum vulgare]|nr:auxin-responsive protein SAUR36-like [Hordeum vulgare]